ncbi:MAG: DUF2855 family protein [Oceanicaulis sp.]
MGWALAIDKTDIAKASLVETGSAPLGDGQARLAVRRFALTANNITYAAFGEIMGYWKFFPAREGGRLPVWGFAEVTESKADGLEIGERIYGYLPAGDELIVGPARIGAGSFIDNSPHRADLPAAYNRYTRCKGDPGYRQDREAVQMVLQPLFLTSWLIDLHLREEGFFGAAQVALTSASSKTALALAWLLHRNRPDGVAIEAMTSKRSMAFVAGTGFYDAITLYDALKELKSEPKRLIVDFAGDHQITTDIHEALGDALAADIRVGAAHWEHAAPPKGLPGPKPVFFFAPDHVARRISEWGPGTFAQRYAADWTQFAEDGAALFEEQELSGGEGALDAYTRLITNTAPPKAAMTVRV